MERTLANEMIKRCWQEQRINLVIPSISMKTASNTIQDMRIYNSSENDFWDLIFLNKD